jgi:hypothetical protein
MGQSNCVKEATTTMIKSKNEQLLDFRKERPT